MELTVAITGASGAIYAHRTLVHLAASGVVERINLIISDSARTVAMVELGFDLRDADAKQVNEWIGLRTDAKTIRLHRLDNLAATPSSGSHPQAGMIVVPCWRNKHRECLEGGLPPAVYLGRKRRAIARL